MSIVLPYIRDLPIYVRNSRKELYKVIYEASLEAGDPIPKYRTLTITDRVSNKELYFIIEDHLGLDLPDWYSLPIKTKASFRKIYEIICEHLTPIETYQVTGRVRNEDSQILKGAMVKLQGKTAYTDDIGAYILTGIRAGRKTITCEADGYVAVSETINVSADTSKDFVLAKIPETKTLHVRTIDFETKQPFGGSEVTVKKGDIVVDTKTTDRTGEVVFNLNIGETYNLKATKDGYISQSTDYKVIKSEDTFYFELKPNPAEVIPNVSVQVNNEETFQGVQGVSVKLTNKQSREVLTGSTTSAGACNFTDVKQGEYTVNLTHNDYEPKTIDEDLRLDHCELNYLLKSNLINVATIHATDATSQRSMKDVKVELTNKDDTSVKYTGMTDDFGNITFSDVKAGTYDCKATNELIDDFTGTCTFNTESFHYEISYNQTKIKAGTITVKDDSTEALLPNVNVTLTGDKTYTSTTDEEGVCSFEKLPIGTYTCKCVAENYSELSVDLEFSVVNDSHNIYLGNTIIDKVTINVLNKIGKSPLKDIKVSIAKAGQDPLIKTTDEMGNAEFPDLPTGEYTISTESEYYEDYTELCIFSKQNKFREIQLAQNVLEQITLKAVDDVSEDPLANVEVILSKNGTAAYAGHTDNDGLIHFDNVPVGIYNIKGSKTIYDDFVDNYTFDSEHREFTLLMHNSLISDVNLTVKDNTYNKPVYEGTSVTLHSNDDDVSYEAVTDSNGKANFKNLKEGIYEVVVDNDFIQTYRDTITLTQAGSSQDITVKWTSIDEIILTTKDIDDESRISNIDVSLKEAFDENPISFKTDAQGRVTFYNLRAGKYHIATNDSAEHYQPYEKDVEFNEVSFHTLDLLLTADKVVEVNFSVYDKVNNVAIPNVHIDVEDEKDTSKHYTTDCDDNGAGKIENIPTGYYNIDITGEYLDED